MLTTLARTLRFDSSGRAGYIIGGSRRGKIQRNPGSAQSLSRNIHQVRAASLGFLVNHVQFFYVGSKRAQCQAGQKAV